MRHERFGRDHTRRRAGIGWAVIAIVVLLTLQACRPAAPIPSDGASAEEVVAAYLEAFVADDCPRARLVTTETFTRDNGDLCGATTLTERRLRSAFPDGDKITFVTSLTTTGTGDGAVLPGEVLWSYTLERQPSGAWRITGGGPQQ